MRAAPTVIVFGGVATPDNTSTFTNSGQIYASDPPAYLSAGPEFITTTSFDVICQTTGVVAFGYAWTASAEL